MSDTTASWFTRVAANQLARRGLEVRRHAAARRQAMLAKHQVDLVFDVGAATGAYGSQLRAFGYTGRIVSFEPLSGAYASLCDTVEDDGLWSAVNCALGAEPGQATIHVAGLRESSSLLPMLDAHREAAPWNDFVSDETITINRLDDAVADIVRSAQNPFLKIDTQGFEREVLAGGPQTVARCVGIQLELSFVPLYDGGMLVDEAIGWAYAHGFHLVGVEQGWAAPSGEILQVDGVFTRVGADG